jgi:hypothetical protein
MSKKDLKRQLEEAKATIELLKSLHQDSQTNHEPEKKPKNGAKQLFFCKLIFRHNWLAG